MQVTRACSFSVSYTVAASLRSTLRDRGLDRCLGFTLAGQIAYFVHLRLKDLSQDTGMAGLTLHVQTWNLED